MIKASLAIESIAVPAVLASTIISANGVDAVGFVGAIVPAGFALVDIFAFGNRQRRLESVFTFARIRSHRIDALAPRRTMVRPQSALVHVVAGGSVAFEPGIAHALRVVSGQTSGVGVARESVTMRTA